MQRRIKETRKASRASVIWFKYKFNVYNSIEYDNNIHEFIIKVNKIGLVYLFENKNFVRYCRNKIKKQILTKKDN